LKISTREPFVVYLDLDQQQLRRIACILEKWIFEKPAFSEEDIAGTDDSKLHRLLHYCRKYVRLK